MAVAPIDGPRVAAPPAPPQVDSAWLLAARVLGASTVIASLLVTAGLVYMRSSMDALREEVARMRADVADAGAQTTSPRPAAAPDDVPFEDDASVAVVVPSAPDAAAVASAPDVQQVGFADVAPSATQVRGDAATGPLPGLPADTVRVRLMGQLRSGVSDCVEGVEEPRFVVMTVRFDGTTGSVTRVRLHGIFQEPPLGPCIEQVVRGAHIDPFPAPSWDVDFRFPVPPPRWRPPT